VVLRGGTNGRHGEFSPLDAPALLALPQFVAAARFGAGGRAPRVVQMRTLPPTGVPADAMTTSEVIASSTARFGRDVAAVDAAIVAQILTARTEPRRDAAADAERDAVDP
jgi:hypothetical protein